jgi:hypothetical protein
LKDLKPSNIFFSGKKAQDMFHSPLTTTLTTDFIVIGDFGLAG